MKSHITLWVTCLVSLFSPFGWLYANPVYFNVVGEREIKTAYCKSQTPIDISEIASFLNQFKSNLEDPKENASIRGVEIIQEHKTLIEVFQNLTKNVVIGEAYASSLSTSCKTVYCAAKDLWGDIEGQKILYLMIRYGINASPITFSNSQKPFRDSELDQIISVLRDYPETVFPLQNINLTRIYKLRVVPSLGQHGQYKPGEGIFLYSGWGGALKTDYGSQYTFFHELAHSLADYWGRIDLEKPFTEFSWKVKADGEFSLIPNHGLYSTHAKSHPQEDFAEAIVSYRFTPKALKRTNIKKYQFMKEVVFDGVEYDSVENCSKEPQSKKLLQKALTLSKSQNPKQGLSFSQVLSCGLPLEIFKSRTERIKCLKRLQLKKLYEAEVDKLTGLQFPSTTKKVLKLRSQMLLEYKLLN